MRNASVGCAGSVNARGGLDDQIGLCRAASHRRTSAAAGSVVRIALRRAACSPTDSIDRDLAIGEQPLADEVADAGLDLPRRHEAAARDLRDLRGALADFVVGRQRNGPGRRGDGTTRRRRRRSARRRARTSRRLRRTRPCTACTNVHQRAQRAQYRVHRRALQPRSFDQIRQECSRPRAFLACATGLPATTRSRARPRDRARVGFGRSLPSST